MSYLNFALDVTRSKLSSRFLIDLIKLLAVFDEIKLDRNNTRKCMIERRSEIPGFYKAYLLL